MRQLPRVDLLPQVKIAPNLYRGRISKRYFTLQSKQGGVERSTIIRISHCTTIALRLFKVSDLQSTQTVVSSLPKKLQQCLSLWLTHTPTGLKTAATHPAQPKTEPTPEFEASLFHNWTNPSGEQPSERLGTMEGGEGGSRSTD